MKYVVTMIKEVREEAQVVVDAADEEMANQMALTMTMSDCEIDWYPKELGPIDIISVEKLEEAAE